MRTKVFVLQTDKEDINNILKELNYKGYVFKLTKELYERKYKYGILGHIFVDRDIYNDAWFDLYENHIFNPVKEDPWILGDYKIYNNLPYDEETELQKRIKSDFLDKLTEENKTCKMFFRYLASKDVHDFPRFALDGNSLRKERFRSWISKNISLFPEYKKLLEMYDFHDISEIFGSYVDIFREPADSYLGGVSYSSELNYKLYANL